jgi:hypothetical protein
MNLLCLILITTGTYEEVKYLPATLVKEQKTKYKVDFTKSFTNLGINVILNPAVRSVNKVTCLRD